MCDKCADNDLGLTDISHNRRNFLKTGAALAAAPLFAGLASNVQAASADKSVGSGPYSTKAYGTTDVTAPLKPMIIQRRTLGPHDVLLDVLYCGICHSDIHQARNEWPATVPTTFMRVLGSYQRSNI